MRSLTPSMCRATAEHHRKMARVFESVGKLADAEAAREAARRCDAEAARLWAHATGKDGQP